MRRLVHGLALPFLIVLALLLARGVTAQEPAAQRLRLYLQCGACDSDYVRTELTWVDHVRDRQDADVHVLVTTQSTGAGGREYLMEFIGRGPFESRVDTLLYRSTRDDTPDLVRQGLLQVLKMGLMPYLVGTPAERQLLITLMPAEAPARPGARPPSQEETRDPWDYWVFSISGNGFVNGESQQKFTNYGLSLSANRTTETWKFGTSLSRSYSESSFDIEDETFTSFRKSWNANLLLVRSLGPHFSAGVSGGMQSSTFGNIELGLRLAPAVEYDLFPYSESTRRFFTFRYSVGLNSFDYREVTVFNETKETRPAHALEVDYRLTQPWGNLRLGADLSQFLHDADKWRGSLSASTSLRLVRGLSLNIGGSYSRVRDQLSLEKGDATRDEILLRLRQLRTNYFYFLNFGLSYRFGSAINNVVNPRMGGLGGFSGSEGIMIIM